MPALLSTLLSSVVVLGVAAAAFGAATWSLRRFGNDVTAANAVEIAGVTIGVVGLIFTGIWIPNKISQDSNTRQDRSTCFNAVLSLRKNVDSLNVNYTVAPQQFDRRMADWDSLGTELENTYFGCRNVKLHSVATLDELTALRSKFSEAKQNSMHLAPDRDYLKEVTTWSSNALSGLQSE